jgi:hypothetical protein
MMLLLMMTATTTNTITDLLIGGRTFNQAPSPTYAVQL